MDLAHPVIAGSVHVHLSSTRIDRTEVFLARGGIALNASELLSLGTNAKKAHTQDHRKKRFHSACLRMSLARGYLFLRVKNAGGLGSDSRLRSSASKSLLFSKCIANRTAHLPT